MELMIFGAHRKEFHSLLSPVFSADILSCGTGKHHTDAILVIAPTAVHPAILAVSGPSETLARRYPNACLVTCGMSPRDSVSCSSVADGRAVLSIVRELPVIGGGFVDVQDICLPLTTPLPAGQIALLAAACLCAGISPERLAQKSVPDASIFPHRTI